MTATSRTTPRRSLARALALAPAVALLTVAPAAFAEPPESWAEADPVSPLSFLLVLLLIPAALFVVITLLTALTARDGNEGYQPGLAWRNEPEWFGGPQGGLDRADATTPEAIEAAGQRGGSRGQW